VCEEVEVQAHGDNTVEITEPLDQLLRTRRDAGGLRPIFEAEALQEVSHRLLVGGLHRDGDH
jgi:hypothetical protein